MLGDPGVAQRGGDELGDLVRLELHPALVEVDALTFVSLGLGTCENP